LGGVLVSRVGNYYAIDPDTAMDLRGRNEDPRIIDRLNPSLLRGIDQMGDSGAIREHSWLAYTYRTAGELLNDYIDSHEGQVPQYRVIFEKRRRGELRDEQGNRLDNPTDIHISEQPVIIWVDDGHRALQKIMEWRRHGGIYFLLIRLLAHQMHTCKALPHTTSNITPADHRQPKYRVTQNYSTAPPVIQKEFVTPRAENWVMTFEKPPPLPSSLSSRLVLLCCIVHPH